MRMRLVAGAMWTLLVFVGLTVVPLSAQATGTGNPVIVSPAAGSTWSMGLGDVTVDFSDAPVGEWTITVVDAGGAAVDSVTYDFDGTNPTAVLSLGPLTISGAYTALVATADGTVGAESSFSVIAPPAAPTDPRTTSGARQGTLTWGAPSDDGGSPVSGYQVQRGSAAATRHDLGSTARSFVYDGLTNGTTYRLSVRALNAAGYGAWVSANVTPATVPPRPSSPHATPRSRSATLAWSYRAGDNGGSALLGYQVQVGTTVATRLDLPPSTRAHTFRRLTNGRTYTLYVRAENAVGFGRWARARTTPARRPYAPSPTRATASSHRVTLHWRYSRGRNGGVAIDRYQVQRGSSAGTRRTVGRRVRSHVFRGLRNGRTYTLYVRAHNRLGYGPWARASARPHAAASPPSGCTPGYSPCLPPASDYDCAGGSGNGPRYAVGPIYVTGSDPYDLDSDGDGVACEQ